MKTRKAFVLCLFSSFVFAVLVSCAPGSDVPSVVVYTSVDQVYSEPIFNQFEKMTGIDVLAVYDVEASKTTGLVQRLIEEKNHPRADVFWNGEIVQTMLLKRERILTPYVSPSAEDIPVRFKDPEGYWTGTGGRARVLLINSELLAESQYPRSLMDLLDPRYPADKIGMAYPLFGTTKTHAAALYAALGPEKARDLFEKLHSRGIRVVDGNSLVRDLVVQGDLIIGLTDTDDSCAAIERGAPVRVIFPDQDSMGTLVIPSTVALIDRGPNPVQGRELVDYLLGREVEKAMIDSGFFQMTLRNTDYSAKCLPILDVRPMGIEYEDLLDLFPVVTDDMSEIFIR